MNVTEIINLAREYLDEPSDEASDYPDSSLIQFINAEHRHLYSVIRSTYEDWQGKEYIFPVTSGTLIYTLPRDIVHPRRVELISSGVTQTTDTSVSPNYSYYTVDEANVVVDEILPQAMGDNQSGQALDYVQNRVRQIEGYSMWDSTIRFSNGVDLSGTQYCRIFYMPTSIDLHQAVCGGAGSNYITLGTSGAATTVGNIRKIDGYYKGAYVEIVSGNGAREIKRIDRHDPTSGTIWIEGTWTTTPNTSSVYSIVSPLIEDYQELLALGATIRGKGLKTEDDVSVVGTIYSELLADLKSSLEKRNEQRVRRVKRTSGGY